MEKPENMTRFSHKIFVCGAVCVCVSSTKVYRKRGWRKGLKVKSNRVADMNTPTFVHTFGRGC